MCGCLSTLCPHPWTAKARQNSLQNPKSALFPAFVLRSTKRYDLCTSVSQHGRHVPGMKPRILIVDDDSQTTQQLYWTLCDEYDVVTANDMQTAIPRRGRYYAANSLIG